MYLKDYRRRRRSSPLLRWLFMLVLIVAGGTFIYLNWDIPGGGSLPLANTPTPLPTPTRSAMSFQAEGDALYREGLLTGSVEAHARALDMEPEHIEMYVNMTRLLVWRGRPERGLEMARMALLIEPDNPQALTMLCMAYDWLGVTAEAVRACERAISLDPTHADAYSYLAEAYMDAGRWFDANDAIRTALELDINSVDVLRNYGYILEMQGNYSGAIQAYKDALARHEMGHLHMAIGRNAQVLGNSTLAQESFAAAVEADPQSAAAADLLAWYQLLQGDYGPAQRNFEQALELDPTYYRSHGRLATLYFQRRNYEDAIPAYRNAIRYADAEARRRVVYFIVTLEPTGALEAAPTGPEVLRVEFVHPYDPEGPLRGLVVGGADYPAVQGSMRLDVLSGRYNLRLQGLPPAPFGQSYIGWFTPLQSPERSRVYTPPLIPLADGSLSLDGTTGAVRRAPIEYYYTLALCHYFLDQCSEALPYIEIALRIDPEDANALQTRRLCNP